MIEEEIHSALTSAFSGRVYPDVAPHTATLPFVTYQAIGGETTPTFCGDPEKTNSVFQISVWAKTRLSASSLMRTVAQTLTGPTMFGTARGGIIGRYDTDTKTFGAMQDISFWR
jgi:hypothetical protein